MHVLLTYIAPVLIVNIGNACAYAFQVVLARSLSPADVGAFNAMLSSVTLMAAPASIAPVAITRMTLLQRRTAGDAGIAAVVGRTTMFALAVALVAGVAVAMAGPFLKGFLKLHDNSTVVLFALMFAVTLIFPVPAGWFQGLGRNVAMAMVQAGMPTLRFVFGALFLLAFAGGLDAAVMASALPCVVVFLAGLVTLWPGRSAFFQPLAQGLASDTLRFVLPAAATSTLIYALFNLDMVLVRALMPPEQSGLYAIASVLGRIPFLLPAALAGIFFADLARVEEQAPAALRGQIIRNFAVMGGIAFALAGLLALAAEPLLVLMGGQAYAAAVPIMRISAFAMAGLSLLNLSVTLSMARDDHRPLWILLAGVGGFASASVFLAATTQDIVTFLAIGTYVMAALCILLLFQTLKRSRRLAGAAAG